MSAGSKARTGEKLSKDVLAVWNASCQGCERQLLPGEAARAVKREVKAELEEESSPSRPSKSLKKCLSSSSQILQLYSGSSSSSNVKVMRMYRRDKHTHTHTRGMSKCNLEEA